MSTYRILHVVLFFVTLLASYFAYERYERGNHLSFQLKSVEQELAVLEVEEVQLRELPDKPLLPMGSAMGDFIVALRAETDLLGGTARIELAKTEVTWQPIKNGVSVVNFGIEVTSTSQGAPAILSMVAGLVESRAVRIPFAEIKSLADTTSLKARIELFGRQE